MKTKAIVYAAMALIFAVNHLCAQEISNREFAKRILQKNYNVKEGDVVVISGGQHTIPLMEAFTIEAQKMGAIVNTLLTTDSIVKDYYHFLPVKYYGNNIEYLKSWLKLINVSIELPEVENLAEVYKGATDERNSLINNAYQSYSEALNSLKVRGGYIGIPTKTAAEDCLLDFNTYKELQWNGLNADYEKISLNAKILENLLKNSKTIELTTAKGTNLTFSVSNRKCIINDGIVDSEDEKSDMFYQKYNSLPGGNICVTTIENSGNGKVFIPKDRYNSCNIQNISFDVKNGKLLNYKAEKGAEFFFGAWNHYSGDKDMIGGIQIGLNPGLKIMEDKADYRPGEASGMVYVWFGDNYVQGGNNKATGTYSYWFPITNATLKIDGKEVIKDGKLTL